MNIALAIIIDKGKILIGKIKSEKISDYGGLTYVFPCENVKDRDGGEEELVKEVKKQTDLDIRIVRKIGDRIHPSTQNHTYYFHCEKDPEQTVTIGSGTDFELFVWTDIGELQNHMPTLFDEVTNYLKDNN